MNTEIERDRLTHTVTLETFEAIDWPKVSAIWADLAEHSPYTTFFTAPEWVATWLTVFGSTLPVEILVFREGARSVGVCLIIRRTLQRGPFRVRCVFLNTAGEDEGDGPVIEFNNILCLAGSEQGVSMALVAHINTRPWDEIWLNGFCQGPPLDALHEAWSGIPRHRRVMANYYVDLTKLRNPNVPYETVLGSKDRARLRQNFRFYGHTEVTVPQDVDGALAVFRELGDLHTTSWERRNETGAFRSRVFRAFHESLIRRCVGINGIQLVRVQATEGLIGILYNMIYRGKVYFYQSGLVYSSNKRVRPGFVTLARAVQYCVEHPELREFHFMAGGDHYKQPMATGRQELEWIVVQNLNWKNALIRSLRRIKRQLPQRRKTTPDAGTPAGGETSEN